MSSHLPALSVAHMCDEESGSYDEPRIEPNAFLAGARAFARCHPRLCSYIHFPPFLSKLRLTLVGQVEGLTAAYAKSPHQICYPVYQDVDRVHKAIHKLEWAANPHGGRHRKPASKAFCHPHSDFGELRTTPHVAQMLDISIGSCILPAQDQTKAHRMEVLSCVRTFPSTSSASACLPIESTAALQAPYIPKIMGAMCHSEARSAKTEPDVRRGPDNCPELQPTWQVTFLQLHTPLLGAACHFCQCEEQSVLHRLCARKEAS